MAGGAEETAVGPVRETYTAPAPDGTMRPAWRLAVDRLARGGELSDMLAANGSRGPAG